MISNQIESVRYDGNNQIRLEWKGVKASGGKLGISERRKKIGEEQSKKSV